MDQNSALAEFSDCCRTSENRDTVTILSNEPPFEHYGQIRCERESLPDHSTEGQFPRNTGYRDCLETLSYTFGFHEGGSVQLDISSSEHLLGDLKLTTLRFPTGRKLEMRIILRDNPKSKSSATILEELSDQTAPE